MEIYASGQHGNHCSLVQRWHEPSSVVFFALVSERRMLANPILFLRQWTHQARDADRRNLQSYPSSALATGDASVKAPRGHAFDMHTILDPGSSALCIACFPLRRLTGEREREKDGGEGEDGDKTALANVQHVARCPFQLRLTTSS